MTLNVAQYLAPLNSGQVLNGYTQGVKQGVGIAIAPDGTISLDPTGASTLGFLTSSIIPAPVYAWPAVGASQPTQGFLQTDGLGNLKWSADYVSVVPANSTFPHMGAAVMPVGVSALRPAPTTKGLLRYNDSTGAFEFSNGTSWLPMTPATGGVFSFISNVTPTANAPGDFWLDTGTNQEKVWDGAIWVPTTPLATTTTPGRVKIGSNVQIALDGTISILPTTGVAGLVSNIGVTTITDNVLSSSIDSALSANQGRLLQAQINALVISSNLTLAGLISGGGLMTYVTPEGTLQGFVLGAPLPVSSVTNDEYFVIVESAGGFTPPGGTFISVTQGDWLLSTGTSWQFLNVGYDPPIASTTQFGITRLATDTETQTGADSAIAVTPFSLRSRTIYKSDFNAKGDLLSASADDVPTILSVGTVGQVLTVDPTAPTGLKWNTPGYYNLDDISGAFDGTATSFSLSIGGVAYTPVPISNIMVFIGGVAQTPGAAGAYIIVGSTISFTSAPPAGATFYATTVK